MSQFAATGRHRAEAAAAGTDEPPADARMEQALERLAGEAEGLKDDDPRQAAALMRRFSELSGMPLNAGMQEALQRMERGEDPDRIEEEMGDVFGDDDAFDEDAGFLGPDADERRGASKVGHPVRHEKTLYELNSEDTGTNL